MHGVAVTGIDQATYQHRRLLADYGFTPLAGADDLLVLTARTDSVFLHARQAVAALRSTGAAVSADAVFDYAEHPGYPSPAAAAAGPNPRIVTPGTGPAADVVLGTHPEHGITAADRSGRDDAAQLLAQQGFYRTPGNPELFALNLPDNDGTRRATDAVTALRAAGLHVSTDLAYESRAAEAAPAPPTHTGPADPFLTRPAPAVPPKDTALSERSAPPAGTAAADPFHTRLHPAPAAEGAPDARIAAMVTNRQKTLTVIGEILAALSQQLRDDPDSLDPVAVAATLADAQSTLGGVRQDLEAITAAAPARPRAAAHTGRAAVTPALSARARAARATSVRLGRVTASQPAEAVRRAEDPRVAYSIHTR
ncbi:hypothetical protein HUT16_17525 [Kitasatospora sp. NA04385]|uniref:hypothetical protein n=1 Tax=Kitasatospora sp. NA04385 TaxID=2742135 RepID=UPI00158FC7F8|nr:hypothetical protein [Kitasatospora sp. NA04385]QKW20631.1 hypothetical protein HUT16_17525 [Kitasatospora sp. NA04385]